MHPCAHYATGTNTPHSRIFCLPHPAWTKRPRTLNPSPWFCQLKPGQSTGCPALATWGGLEWSLAWDGSPCPHPGLPSLLSLQLLDTMVCLPGCCVYMGHDVHAAHIHPYPDTCAYGPTPTHVLMCMLTPLLTSAAKRTLNLQKQGPRNELGVFSQCVS